MARLNSVPPTRAKPTLVYQSLSDSATSLAVANRVDFSLADNSSMTITSEASTDSIATISTKPLRDCSIFFTMR